MPVFVEVYAVVARMVEHAVENNADPVFFRFVRQSPKILFRPEIRIDVQIIGSIVAMIGSGLKNRIEVNRRYVQTAQIRQFFLYSPPAFPRKNRCSGSFPVRSAREEGVPTQSNGHPFLLCHT